MAQVSINQLANGTIADATAVDANFNAIAAQMNGNLDATNLAAGAVSPTILDSTYLSGWITGQPAPTAVVANGNRSYNLTYNASILPYQSNGMRRRFTRTVAAPTQCTNLNGTTQFYSRLSASVNGMSFTNNFVVSAWIKIPNYPSSQATIVSRYNGTSGWSFDINSSGQVRLLGYNGGATNIGWVTSYQSIPLNKWVHVVGQLDMTSTTNSPTINYIMIDGVDVPAFVSRGGTAPTSLLQAGNLEIGSRNATPDFSGKIAQVAIYSAKVTEATILASMHQALGGAETSEISAYSFNNSINDLNVNHNDLTANGSAVATTVDSPFGNSGVSTTLEYAITTAISANGLTETVQVPEGCALPTTGGISIAAYSTQKIPYGFPGQKTKWNVELILLTAASTSGTSINTVYNPGGLNLSVPIGEWVLRSDLVSSMTVNNSSLDVTLALSTSASTFTLPRLSARVIVNVALNSSVQINQHSKADSVSLAAATPYYLILWSVAPFSAAQIHAIITANPLAASVVVAELAHL